VIANRLGAIAIWALAIVLAVILALDVRGDSEPPDRALVPGFDAAQVTALAWSGGGRAIRIERDTGSSTGWKWVVPVGEADRQSVEDLLAALRGARWHRRVDPAAAGAIGTTLVVESGSGRTAISIGEPLGEQRWLVVGDRAVLVDGWVVRALAPEPIALRVRHPFAAANEAEHLEVDNLELAGWPRRMIKLGGLPADLLVRPGPVAELERALEAVEVIALPTAKLPVDTNFRGTRIAFDHRLVAVEMGYCPPDRRMHAIVGPAIGPGCTSESAWTGLLDAIQTFQGNDRIGAALQLVEPRPVPVSESIAPTALVLADGATLDVARRPRVRAVGAKDARDADPAQIAELIGVLAVPGEPVALPAGAPTGHLRVTTTHDQVFDLELFGGGIIARRGEPVALQIGDGAAAILARGGAAYIDPLLWNEEPFTIHAIAIANARYTRGAVVGEWMRDGKPTDGKPIDELVGLLAAPRATGPASRASRPVAVRLDIRPPVGAPTRHEVSIGRSGQGDATCVLADPAPHAVADRICALVDGLR